MIATPLGKAVLLGRGGCVPFSRIDGSVSANSTFAHPANGVIAWTQTTLPSSGSTLVYFRMQVAGVIDNSYVTEVAFNGNFIFYDVVATVVTQRAIAVGAVSNGHRIAIVPNANSIQGWSNGILRWTYSSASNFATATAGKLTVLGTGGAVSNLKTWLLACRAMEGV